MAFPIPPPPPVITPHLKSRVFDVMVQLLRKEIYGLWREKMDTKREADFDTYSSTYHFISTYLEIIY